MTTLHQPHDKLFKKSMEDIRVATDFFTAHVPEKILKTVNLATLKLEKQTFVSEHYKYAEADVIYSVETTDALAYFYLLCENQSSIDRMMAFRLLSYMMHLLQVHHKNHPQDPLPLVYPLVIYTGEEEWSAPREIFDLFGTQAALAREIFFQPYQLIDIQRMSDDEIMQQRWSGLVEFALKYHHQQRNLKWFLNQLLPWVEELARCKGADFTKIVLRYSIDGMEKSDEKLFTEKCEQFLSRELRGEVMTLTEHWKQTGVQEGIQKGRQEGQLETKQQLAKKLLDMGMPLEKIVELTELPPEALLTEQDIH